MPFVAVEHHGSVTVLTLDRPPVNAIALAICEQLFTTLEKIVAKPPAGGLVVIGRGRAFSAGADLKEVPTYDAAQRSRLDETFSRAIRALLALPTPVVAALNGHAIGGGLVLALAGDHRIAAERPAEFGFPEAAVGIAFPPVPMAIIRGAMNPVALNRLALDATARWPLDRARQEGLIDVVVPADRLLEAAIGEAKRLSAAPGYALVKQQLRATTLAEVDRLLANR